MASGSEFYGFTSSGHKDPDINMQDGKTGHKLHSAGVKGRRAKHQSRVTGPPPVKRKFQEEFFSSAKVSKGQQLVLHGAQAWKALDKCTKENEILCITVPRINHSKGWPTFLYVEAEI